MRTFELEGREALLLAEACKIDAERKRLNERLAALKEEMDFDEPGTYVNDANDKLVISETEKFSEISPKTVLTYLKKNKMASRFPETVKVQVTPLKKLIPEDVINRWRKKIGVTLRWTFK